MQNADRGQDNWMIKFCPWNNCDISINSADTQVVSTLLKFQNTTLTKEKPKGPHIHVGAIDNSLSFPIKHPR